MLGYRLLPKTNRLHCVDPKFPGKIFHKIYIFLLCSQEVRYFLDRWNRNWLWFEVNDVLFWNEEFLFFPYNWFEFSENESFLLKRLRLPLLVVLAILQALVRFLSSFDLVLPESKGEHLRSGECIHCLNHYFHLIHHSIRRKNLSDQVLLLKIENESRIYSTNWTYQDR